LPTRIDLSACTELVRFIEEQAIDLLVDLNAFS
jgi:hypothetical protein